MIFFNDSRFVVHIQKISAYRQFKDSNTFFEEMKKIFNEKEHKEN